MGTHLPYHPPRHAIERCAPDVIRNKQLQRYLQRFNSDIYGWLAPLAGEIDDERKAAIDGMYNAEVFAQDEHVGKFLDQLREKGTLDNTILIIAADHGEHMGEKQLVGHLFSVYNELVHVPLIIHDPTGNMPAGTEVDQVVSTRRLFHTILTAADLANEAEERYSLAQSAASDPDGGIVFSEGVPPQNVVNLLQRRLPHLVRDRNCDQTRRAVLDGELKLIKTGDDTNLELYRITDDPNERRNIHDMAPERVQALCDHLLTFVSDASTAAPAAESIEEDTDPELRRRLHDLGYIE
jgi:arylsulfatase A-like enzyme